MGCSGSAVSKRHLAAVERDTALAVAAVELKVCGTGLQYAAASSKQDDEIVLAAVMNTGHALRYATEAAGKTVRLFWQQWSRTWTLSTLQRRNCCWTVPSPLKPRRGATPND
eukprot:3606676-Amphidinium_carterae.2